MVIAPEIMKGHKGESIGVGHLRNPKNAIWFVWYVEFAGGGGRNVGQGRLRW